MEEIDLEHPIPDCSDCKYYEDKGNNKYTCKYLRKKKTYFCSDSTDTAEECKYYEFLKPPSQRE